MSNLDQIVKGAPPPGTSYPIPSTTPIIKTESSNASPLSDPLANLPSSPPQIYLNLLILEASLRAQWLQLRTRRRQHTFFLTLLALWTCYFGYALFFQLREDGSGLGGSVYWVVEVAEKVCFGGGLITGVLVWGTGQWERGIRWPRRWLSHTNRGLRGFNCKLVVIKQSWWREVLSTLSFLFSYGLFSGSGGSSYRYVEHSVLIETEKAQRNGGHHALPNISENDVTGQEEDLAPGGDYVKLLLLPKPFSATFRENWEEYRLDYWEKENERRAHLRARMKEQDRKLAKEQGGWLWWTGYRGFGRSKTSDAEKIHHNVHRVGSLIDKDYKRPRSGSTRSGSHSRNSSRSTTPIDLDEKPAGRERRGSSASDRRGKRTGTQSSGGRVGKLAPPGSRSATPDAPSPLVRKSSFTSVSSGESGRPGTADGEVQRESALKPKQTTRRGSYVNGK